MFNGLVLLGLGLACLVGAAVLRGTAEGPEAITPQVAQTVWVTPTPELSEKPVDRSLLPQLRRSAEPGAAVSASPSGSPIASASGSASGSPSGSASPTASSSASGSPSLDPSGSPSGGQLPAPSAGATVLPTPLPSASSLAQLHQQAIVVDTHVETPMLITERFIKLRNNSGQVSLEKLRKGGVDVVFFSIFVNPYRYAKTAKSQADFMIKALKKEIQNNQDMIELATSSADIQRIVRSGKIAGLMGMEGADPIGGQLDNIDYFYKQGVRYLGPTWSTHTLMADSSGPGKPRWKGLSDFGKKAVERMNKLGMVIDVSHLSDAAFYDVIKASKQPVIASHSAVDGVAVNARNLSNDMLKLLAVNGGTVGILFYPPHLKANGVADVKAVVDHIDYAVKVAGIDHVGLGSDFDGLDRPPPTGLQDASRFEAITKELKARKYTDAQIYKILGGNFLRVFEQVWKK